MLSGSRLANLYTTNRVARELLGMIVYQAKRGKIGPLCTTFAFLPEGYSVRELCSDLSSQQLPNQDLHLHWYSNGVLD